MWILNHYVSAKPIYNEPIEYNSHEIAYLETSIKCVELYQWLSRHFKNKHFFYDERELLENKSLAVDKLNELLSDKIVPTCSSCGCKLPEDARFPICEECFQKRRFRRGPGDDRAPKRRGASSGGNSKYSKNTDPTGRRSNDKRKPSRKRKFSRK